MMLMFPDNHIAWYHVLSFWAIRINLLLDQGIAYIYIYVYAMVLAQSFKMGADP